MKKIFTGLFVGFAALVLSAFAVGQVRKALSPYGVPTDAMPASGEMLSAKAVKGSQKSSADEIAGLSKLNFSGSQKARLAKMSKIKKGGRVVEPSPVMRLRAAAPFESDVNAKITLDVQADYDDGTGFQLLLDADHTACGDDFELGGYYTGGDYSFYEYLIPANASATDNFLFAGQSASVEIPAGTYDYVITNPDGETIYMLSKEIASGDDFEFEAGTEYIFSIVPDGYYISVMLTVPHEVDLAVKGITSLSPSTALTDSEAVIATVANEGTNPISSFSLKLTVDGKEIATEAVSHALASGESMEYTFNAKADLSSEGIHTVSVEAMADGDNNADNNVATVSVNHFAPADIPYSVDFTDPSKSGECWSGSASWSYDDVNGAMWFDGADYQPLVFRGMHLEAGKAYKFEFKYAAGYDFYGIYQMTEDFKVVCGREDTPVEGWSEVLSYKDAFTDGYFVSDGGTVECEESGVYSIAIVPEMSSGELYIRSIGISEKQDYDAGIVSVRAPSRIPAEQASKFIVTVSVSNDGSKVIESASVAIKSGTAEVGRAKVEDIEVGKVASVPVAVALADAVAGDMAELEVTVTIDGHESEDTDDGNHASKSVSITEDVLGYDFVDEGMYTDEYSIGTQSGTICCGVPFNLASEDVLTGISIGWDAADGQEIVLSVYEYDPATLTLGKEIYSGIVPQGMEAGQIAYDIAPRLLEAGDYMAAVTFSGLCLVSDMTADGMLYVLSSNYMMPQQGLGTPAIRTVFGEGNPLAKDAVVVEIPKPANRGLFSANEPVAVKLKNDGSDEIAGTLSLSVNGGIAGSQSITLGGYDSSEFTFEVDLSKPGEYVLEVVASVEGDENPDNNSLSKTVFSEEPADPYAMDFEFCDDFATSGFNPAWKAVDGDGESVYGFQGITFPVPADGKFGYIIFNPSKTEPSMANEAAIAPHGGERFAASFASSGPEGAPKNDDWLISPKLTLPSEDAGMSFFVKSYTGAYGLEKYNVLVSETDDNIGSFEMIGSTREAPVEEWTEVNVDLSEYAGKDVYLAIQCVSEDAFIFMLDDITVSKSAGSVAENAVAALSLYPNPATDVIVISSGGSEIENVDIYNAAGAMVYSSKVSDSGSFRYNVSALDAGIYFAKVSTSDGIKVMRFMVK